jgi:hypothetical protein
MQMAHADDVARRGSKEIGVRWGLGRVMTWIVERLENGIENIVLYDMMND